MTKPIQNKASRFAIAVVLIIFVVGMSVWKVSNIQSGRGVVTPGTIVVTLIAAAAAGALYWSRRK